MSISIEEYNKLLLKIEELTNKNNELEEHLKKYTNSKSHQKYYQKKKDNIFLKQNAAKELGYTTKKVIKFKSINNICKIF